MKTEKIVEARDKSLREMFGAVIKKVKARYEIADPRPLAPPVGYQRQPSLGEMIREQVRSAQLAEAARTVGAETFEEHEDFDLPDDPMDPSTPYENDFDTPVGELRRRQEEELATLAAGGDPKPSLEVPSRTFQQEKPKPREDAAAAPPPQDGPPPSQGGLIVSVRPAGSPAGLSIGKQCIP